jgi:hypothetical protein
MASALAALRAALGSVREPGPQETHVDLVSTNPLAAGGDPKLIRCTQPDDPMLGSQVKQGWGTYSYVSEPHTMGDCPFREPGPNVTEEMVERASLAYHRASMAASYAESHVHAMRAALEAGLEGER